jgi:hypothetical protein
MLASLLFSWGWKEKGGRGAVASCFFALLGMAPKAFGGKEEKPGWRVLPGFADRFDLHSSIVRRMGVIMCKENAAIRGQRSGVRD